MQRIIGIVMVIVCTFGGYMAMGGKMSVLWQPFEVVIILGSGMSAFAIGNSAHTIKDTLSRLGGIFGKSKFGKAEYQNLLVCLFTFLKLMKAKGALALESHIEKPQESTIFEQFPSVKQDHLALDLICDTLRIITTGQNTPHVIDALMEEEVDGMNAEFTHAGHAVQTLADGLPALGIVAAVLGVIKTMGSITEPPEILGKLIGGALVGTFLGVWLAYGFIAPLATAMSERGVAEAKYYGVIRTAIIAYLQGTAPQMSVEFARKTIEHDLRPGFAELEEALENAPKV